jgi:hypothetical protein
VLTAVATARTHALAAPGHQAVAVVGGFDRAFLVAAGFAAAASLLSLVTVRTRRVIAATTPDSHPPVTPAPAVHAHADAA